jgi:hypothetical protein
MPLRATDRRAGGPSIRPEPEAKTELEVLLAIDAKLDRIAAALERRPAEARSLDVRDRRALEALLPVVAAQFPNATFSTWQLIDAASGSDIAAADMRLALRDLSAPKLGKLLRRAADTGAAFGAFKVERRGDQRGAATWGLTPDEPPFPPQGVNAKLTMA